MQNCEILHSVRGLYDKNSASWYCFTSDVMYKKYKRLVYTSPDLLARFCKINLSLAKSIYYLYSTKAPHVALQLLPSINFFPLVLLLKPEVGSLSNDENGKKQ